MKKTNILFIILLIFIVIFSFSNIFQKNNIIEDPIQHIEDNEVSTNSDKIIVSIYTKNQEILNYLGTEAEKNNFELKYYSNDSNTLTVQGMCPISKILINSTHQDITYLFVVSFIENCFEEDKKAEPYTPTKPSTNKKDGNVSEIIIEGDNY